VEDRGKINVTIIIEIIFFFTNQSKARRVLILQKSCEKSRDISEGSLCMSRLGALRHNKKGTAACKIPVNHHNYCKNLFINTENFESILT
jgi:hypothetical protein